MELHLHGLVVQEVLDLPHEVHGLLLEQLVQLLYQQQLLLPHLRTSVVDRSKEQFDAIFTKISTKTRQYRCFRGSNSTRGIPTSAV